MDPILQKALAELAARKQQLAGTGVKVTPEHEEEFLRAKTGGKYGRQDVPELREADAPAPDMPINARNLGRAFTQGASFGFSDELGLTDRAAQTAFKKQHGTANLLAGIAGGIAAPAVAAAALPEEAGIAGLLGGMSAVKKASLLSGIGGAAYGAGDAEGGLKDRAEAGAVNGALSAVVGPPVAKVVGGVAGMLGSAGNKIINRVRPSRVVSKTAQDLIDDPAAVASQIAEMEKIAPGGASIASTVIGDQHGYENSRFLPYIRAVGASPEAGRQAEAKIIAQRAALEAGRKKLGEQMDKLAEGEIPITADVRRALGLVRGVLGGGGQHTPAAPSASFPSPEGFQPTSLTLPDPNKATMPLSQVRESLSRLRYLSRQYAKVGVDANGVTQHDINEAARALQEVAYHFRPDFQPLDRVYAKVMEQLGTTEDMLRAAQMSRSNHAANEAFGMKGGSLGGSLPQGYGGLAKTALDKLLVDKAGAADATSQLLLGTGKGASVKALQKAGPMSGKAPGALRTGMLGGGLPRALAGLLKDEDDE